jgi:hypothetical protein
MRNNQSITEGTRAVTIVRVGSNDQYATNWDSIFGKGKTAAKKASAGKTSKKATKKAASPKKKPAKKK